MKKFSNDSIKQSDSYCKANRNGEKIDLKNRPAVKGITIDAESTCDIDDAVFLERIGDKWVLSISIADVAEAVPFGSPIFIDALKRKETRYLSDTTIQMLPKRFSMWALSLVPNKNRNTITFQTTLDKNLNVVDFKIFESYCCSSKKISYKEIGEILSEQDESVPYYEMISNLSVLAQNLMEKRRFAGALAFYDLKKGLVTNEEGQIVRLPNSDLTAGYVIIQELMILTNSETSKYFAREDIPFIFKNHTARNSAPDKEEILEHIKLSMANINMLHTLSDKIQLWYNRARYETKLTGHFGLSLASYTHVTSPIRRVMDLINHYIVKAHLKYEPQPFTKEQLDSYCEEMNAFLKAKKDAQASYFFEKENKKRLYDLANSGIDDLLNMNEKEFRRMIKAARQASSIDDKLLHAFFHKMNQNALMAVDVYELIFCSRWSKNQNEFIKICFNYLDKNPGHYISFFDFLQNDSMIKLAYSEVKTKGNKFIARYIIQDDNEQNLTMEFSYISISKKKAVHLAASSIIQGFYHSKLIKLEDSENIYHSQIIAAAEPEVQEKIERKESVSSVNYVGIIHEFSQSHDYFDIVSFEFEDNGVDSINRFDCIVKVKINGETKVFTGKGNNKKEAKQDTAKSVCESCKYFT